MANSRCPLTVAEQKRILQYKQEGWRLKRIAAEMLCSIYTVCKHWRRQRDGQATKPRGRPRNGRSTVTQRRWWKKTWRWSKSIRPEERWRSGWNWPKGWGSRLKNFPVLIRPSLPLSWQAAFAGLSFRPPQRTPLRSTPGMVALQPGAHLSLHQPVYCHTASQQKRTWLRVRSLLHAERSICWTHHFSSICPRNAPLLLPHPPRRNDQVSPIPWFEQRRHSGLHCCRTAFAASLRVATPHPFGRGTILWD